MEDEGSSSCNSRVADDPADRRKLEVYHEVLRRLKDSDNPESLLPGFDDQLWSHFNRLPTRYAVDLNVERAEAVLTHKRLLHLAHDPANRPAFDVRMVQVHPVSEGTTDDTAQELSPFAPKSHPPPAFGSSPNLDALALEGNKQYNDEEHNTNASLRLLRPMHEITFSADDKPKLLSELTSLLADVGLNIQEAHAFSTNDGYSLVIVVVYGWPYEETLRLRSSLEKEVKRIKVSNGEDCNSDRHDGFVSVLRQTQSKEGGGGEGEGEGKRMGLEELPWALLGTIMAKLDIASICSIASTSRTFKSCASHILTFLPSIHLLDIVPSMDLLTPLLPPNPYLTSLKVDCCRLDDRAIDHLVRPSLHELSLHNCGDFSGRLLSEIGARCSELRSLYLGSVADKRGRAIHISDLEELLRGCSELEILNLMFDMSTFLRHTFAQAWTLASARLSSLEIGYISSVMVTELLSPTAGAHQHVQPSILPNLQKLCLSVDYITDTMVGTITQNLTSLTYLDLRDAPIIEPRVTFDLTNNGLQQINQHAKLKHLSLVRSQEFLITYFRRVNDQGILLMADKCASMESICLGGFCRVTDTGFRAILHSCSNLYKVKISHGTQLTDLVFLDISATPLSLTHVGLRWCNLLTNLAIADLASNLDLTVLDLRDCRSLGDEALLAISSLPKLKSLYIDGSDVSDIGISYLRDRATRSLVSLSVRGCKRLTDKCITALAGGSLKLVLQELDLSNLPNLSDNGVLVLAKSRVPICELRMRQCPLIGDTSVMALASMQVDDERWHGNSLRVLDLYNCGRISSLSFRWLKKPYFPRLKWLGVTGTVNRDMVDALARSRPYLHVACRGEELGTGQWDHSDGFYIHDYEEMDELERFILEGNDEISDEEMEEAMNDEELDV